MSPRHRPPIEIRAAEPGDAMAVTELLRHSLGKLGDPHYESFLAWKHRENPAGPSPAWVALDGGRIVGYRTFLRWQFQTADGRELSAVRAVDTATHPDFRGQGVFRALTVQAVADLTRDGQAFVFNTPNSSSRPGYLSMGWQPVARVPVGVLPAGPRSLSRMRASKAPAELWSQPTGVGADAREVFADPSLTTALLAHADNQGVHTHRRADYLRWRVDFAPLAYRVFFADDSAPSAGALVFRLRRRGASLEAALIEAFVPDARTALRVARQVVRASGADYALGVRSGVLRTLIPLPRSGPLLTTRPLASTPPSGRDWRLSLADVELF